MKLFVLPILDNPDTFKCENRAKSMDFVDKIYDIAETISLFKGPDVASLDKLKNIALQTLKPDALKALLLRFFAKVNDFKRFRPILEMIEYRISWLERQLANEHVFSWAMSNAVLPGYPSIEAFFKSQHTQCVYGGNKQFISIVEARKFAQMYGGLKEGYSADIFAAGVGQKSHVVIVKTRAYHDYALTLHRSQLPQLQKESIKIKHILGILT